MTPTSRFRMLAGTGAAVVVAAAALVFFMSTRSPEAQTAPAAPVLAAQAAPAAPVAATPIAPVAPVIVAQAAPAAAPAAPAAAGPATPAAPAPAAATPAAPDANAQPGGGIVATVNGETITEQDLDIAGQEFSDQLANFPLDQRRGVTIDLIIHIRLIAAEAAKQGIDKDPAMVERLRLVHDRALYSEYLNRLFATAVTEDAAHALYDKETAAAGNSFEYHVAHILVPTADEAKAVIAKLDAGGDFAAIAKDESIDSGSAAMGGDLGFIAAGDTVKEFETAAFALDVGKYTEAPVESQFGFHVIKLTEKRPATPKSFQDEIPNLQDELAQAAFQKVIDDLSAKATITKAPAPGPQAATPDPSALPAAPVAPAAPAK